MSHLLPLELWQQILSYCAEPADLCCLASCYEELICVIPKKQITSNLVRSAAATEQWTTLELLLQRETDKHNQLMYTCSALELMLGSGQKVSLLQHFIDTFRVWKVPVLGLFCHGISLALKGGHLALVDWFLDYLHIDCTRPSICLQPIFTRVVKTGDMQVLLWFVAKFKPQRSDITYNHCDIVITAARRGNLHFVKWFVQTHQLSKSDFKGGYGTLFILITAAHWGRREVIHYLVDALEITANDVNVPPHHLPHRAAIDGHVDTLDWLQEHFPMTEESIVQCETFQRSAEHVQVLQWLYIKWPTTFQHTEEGRHQVQQAFQKALEGMYLQSAQWIAATFPFVHANPWIEDECVLRCIKKDRLDMLKWGIEQGYFLFKDAELHRQAEAKALKYQRQDILQHLSTCHSLSPES